MPEDTTIRDAIRENAAGPKAASDDSTSVEQHSIADQILADKYTRTVGAVDSNRNRGIRFSRITPGNNW